jgi:hypothetical protein
MNRLLEAVAPFAKLVCSTSGRIPVEKLSFADWHELVKAYEETMGKCTEEQILATIAEELDYKLGVKTTCVVLRLKNGFEVVGTSACVDPAEYDHDVGKQMARRRALDKVWELEGYLLQSKGS